MTIQQQIGRRSSVDVTYSRRWFRGFSVVDNLALQPSDLTPFNIVAPLDPRLPGGGGYVVTGLYDVVPAKAGQVNNLVVDSTPYGKWYQYFDGLDVTINARVGRSLTVMGGTSTGQTVADNCDVRAHLPELATTATGDERVRRRSEYVGCDDGEPVLPRGLWRADADQRSRVVRSSEDWCAARGDVSEQARSDVGRQLCGAELGCRAFTRQGSLGQCGQCHREPRAARYAYGDRINQFDIRAAKTLKYGRSRTLIAFDVYNMLNSSAVLTYDNTFVPGGPWLQPLTILTPRFFKITVEIHL